MFTFPFDESQESRLMYFMKAEVFPPLYWHGLIKGRWGGPGPFRRFLNPLNVGNT